jgi:hypothetical protein
LTLSPYGGAVYTSNAESNLTTLHCDYIENEATSEGGAIFFYGASYTSSNNHFSGNRATSYGPTLMCYKQSQSLMSCDTVVYSTDYRYMLYLYYSGGLSCSHINISYSTMTSYTSAFYAWDAQYSFSRTTIAHNSCLSRTTCFYGTNKLADVSSSNIV